MDSVCCIHGQIHGQISLLASEVSKKALAAPSWSSAQSPFWKIPLPKLRFYLWSSISCLPIGLLLSMFLVKSKWIKVVETYYWNSLNQAMSATLCDDKTETGTLLQTEVSKATAQSQTQCLLSILLHFLFYHLWKSFHWPLLLFNAVWCDSEAVLELRWPFDFQRTERDQNTYVVYKTEIKA